tara:strand:- start:38 stop:268 length:231 start_codon:yes stop_codon:yes gene_type:complete
MYSLLANNTGIRRSFSISMRVLVKNYGNVRIFKDRPYGYKRWIVEWKDGGTEIYSGIWYKEEQIKRKVERKIDKHR